MPDTLDASLYELPPGALSALTSTDLMGDGAEGRTQLMARLRARIEAMRTDQEKWSHQFDQLHDDAIRGNFSTPFILKWIVALLDKQRAALERLYPFLDALHRNLGEYRNQYDFEMQEVCAETIDLILGWVRPYQNLCGQLIDLASERPSASVDVLRARPVNGEIDYAQLNREHIARYPKIRARLAE